MNAYISTLTRNQVRYFNKRISDSESLVVKIRFDDECQNGHNTFAITAEHWVDGRVESCGCLHDDIAAHFPELAHLIKWHLCATDGPLHYIANTGYFAEIRDLDNARRAAIWADASDEELTSPLLVESLHKRLPQVMRDFRHDMTAMGFEW